MKQGKYSEEQIVRILKEADAGAGNKGTVYLFSAVTKNLQHLTENEY